RSPPASGTTRLILAARAARLGHHRRRGSCCDPRHPMRGRCTHLMIVATLAGSGGIAAPARAQPASSPPAALTDEELALLAEAEAIEIFAERPDKPFDRDTELRLTGAELAARGATDLRTALALLPDVNVRDIG